MSDRIAVFNNGYVEQVGTPYEIYNESKSEFVCDFIGDINRYAEGASGRDQPPVCKQSLDTGKTGFVRIERCIGEPKEPVMPILPDMVEEAEFNGVLTKVCSGMSWSEA